MSAKFPRVWFRDLRPKPTRNGLDARESLMRLAGETTEPPRSTQASHFPEFFKIPIDKKKPGRLPPWLGLPSAKFGNPGQEAGIGQASNAGLGEPHTGATRIFQRS